MSDAEERIGEVSVRRVEPITAARANPGVVLYAAPPRKRGLITALFLLLVALPTLAAGAYNAFVAADVYVSEARFVVRAAASPQPSGFGAFLQTAGLSGHNDTFSVLEYVMSRDAAQTLVQKHALRAVLARPEGDFLRRHPRPWSGATFEDLYKAYPRFVSVSYDATRGISTLRVKTFRPADSHAIAVALLDQSEALVNTLNDRAQRDALAAAQLEVQGAQARIADVQARITQFRQEQGVIDPGRASAAALEIVNRLAAEAALLRAQRSEISEAAPQSPQLAALDRRIAAVEAQIEAERAKVAGPSDALAPKISDFERLLLEREFADKALASALSSLEAARVEAQRQQLYLERVAEPSLPDDATLPKRIQDTLLVMVTGLLAFASLWLILAGLRERQQA